MPEVDIYAPTPEDTLDLQELELYRLIVEYRAEHGLPAIKLSHALTIVAGRHALDQVENMRRYSGHDWSDHKYHVDYPTDRTPIDAPGHLTRAETLGTGFTGQHFEISTGPGPSVVGPFFDAAVMEPHGAFSNWQSSPPHNAVILQWGQTHWHWDTIGVGLHKGIAHVHFSGTPDTTGPHGGIPLIEGTDGADNATLTAFEDIAQGLAGDDTLSAAGGNDILYGNKGLDLLDGGPGDDTLYGGQNAGPPAPDGRLRQGVETLSGGAGDDILYGNFGPDLLDGGDGNDTLYGGKDDDTLLGGAGDDRLHGNKGDDHLAGGPGADLFRFSGGGTDTVRDFDPAGGDRLSLPGPIAGTATAPDGHLVLQHARGEIHLLGVAPEHWDPAGWLATA